MCTNKSPATLAAAFILLSFSLPLSAQDDAPKKASSLSQVRGKIASPEGKAAYDEQMNGTPLPDGFGTSLPPGVAASDVVKLLLPNGNPALAVLVGMKPWPHAKDTYIAFVCIAPNQLIHDRVLKYNNGKPDCEPSMVEVVAGKKPGEWVSTGDYTMAIAVLRMPPSGRPALASTIISWSGIMNNPLGANWSHSNLEGPDGPHEGDKQWVNYPSEFHKFDFAKYAIGDDTTAFGMRTSIEIGYAGGGASFHILTLFAVINGELRVVLSEPIYYYQNLAGDWHEDGARSHDVYEGENVVVSKAKVNGYYKLLVKSKNKKWRQEFRWDPKSLRYVAENN